jgi:hypothetical protein
VHFVHHHPRCPSNARLTLFSVHFTRGAIGGTFVQMGAGEENEEQKGQGRAKEGALAVHIFHHRVEREIQKAEP